jgi:ABC-type multidrug transport system fused ATPase/permease subunit
MIRKGEAKNLLNHFFHNSLGGIMRPTIITLAAYLGVPLSMSTVFMAISMIDWITWPLHMLPHFNHEMSETSRAMTRLQKFLLLDETQEGLVKSEESSWGKNALEIKGNFSWGFINKQEDSDSEGSDKEEEKEEKV